MGRGYSGNHPRFSGKQDERYDAKEAYNKDLTASARLHYLENDRHDHESPAHSHCSPMHNDRAKRLRERAIKISERSGAERGDEYDYENPRVTELLEKAKKIDERSNKKAFVKGAKDFMKKAPKVFDERSGEERRKDIDEMIYERPDSPMNNLKGPVKDRVIEKINNPKPPMPEPPFSGRGGGVIRRRPDKVIDDRYGSPMNQTSPDYKDRPYARANDALKAAELDAHLIGQMKKKQDRLSQDTRFGLSGIADRTRDLSRMARDKQDLISNVQGHMDRDIQTYPQGLGTYIDERSGGIKEAFVNDPRTFVESERKDPERIKRFKNTPLNACAKSEGGSGCVKQMGGAWRVISNKTDKPWPAKYASRSKAEAALRGYHAG